MCEEACEVGMKVARVEFCLQRKRCPNNMTSEQDREIVKYAKRTFWVTSMVVSFCRDWRSASLSICVAELSQSAADDTKFVEAKQLFGRKQTGRGRSRLRRGQRFPVPVLATVEEPSKR